MSNSPSNGDDDPSNGNVAIIAVWAIATIIFVLSPCLCSRYRRELWWKRLRTCTWEVHMEPEPESVASRVARERYESQLQRRRALDGLTLDDEAQICYLFLLERMAGFTKTLAREDFCDKNEIDELELVNMRKSLLSLKVTKTASLSSDDQLHAATSITLDEGEFVLCMKASDTYDDSSRDNAAEVEVDHIIGTTSEVASLHNTKSSDDVAGSPETRCTKVTLLGNGLHHNTTEMLEIDVEKGMSQVVGVSMNGDSSEKSGEDLCVVSESCCEDSETSIRIPAAGNSSGESGELRYVPNGCAICLCPFVSGDRLTWSATPTDPHVFHEHCMLEYLVSVGAKAARKRRQRSSEVADQGHTSDEVTTDFPMLCPCCRQTFISRIPCPSVSPH